MRWILGLFAAASLACFVAVNAAHVANRGVCCADDAFAAVVAKNLAFGHGYSTSLGFQRQDYVMTAFDAHATTGPAVVLPVSLAIRSVGNRTWVPGAVQVALWTLVLLGTGWALSRQAAWHRVAATGGVFLLVVYAVSPFHLEHWYAMLGEVPAALTVLLSYVLWSTAPASRRRWLSAGVFCSLAILAKILAALYSGVLLLAALALAWRSRHGGWRQAGWLCAGFLGPLLAFQAWKLVAIGPGRTFEQYQTLVSLVTDYGVRQEGLRLGVLAERLGSFQSSFGVSLTGMLVLAVLGCALAWRSGHLAFRRLFVALLAGVAAHAAYWLLASVGWPRYFFIGLVLLAALVALPYLAIERRAHLAVYTLALGVSLTATLGRLTQPAANLEGRWFEPGRWRSSQAVVAEYLNARLDRQPFFGQWWAPVADLEYLSRGVLVFRGYTTITRADLERGVLAVSNRRFDGRDDPAWTGFLARCGPPVLNVAPYAVYECRKPRREGARTE